MRPDHQDQPERPVDPAAPVSTPFGSLPDQPRPLGRDSAGRGGIGVIAALVRLIAIVATTIGLIEAAAGLMYAEPRAIALGAAAAAYGLWVASRVALLTGPEREATITRVAGTTLALIG